MIKVYYTIKDMYESTALGWCVRGEETLPRIARSSSHPFCQLSAHIFRQSSLRLGESTTSQILCFHCLASDSAAGHGQ